MIWTWLTKITWQQNTLPQESFPRHIETESLASPVRGAPVSLMLRANRSPPPNHLGSDRGEWLTFPVRKMTNSAFISTRVPAHLRIDFSERFRESIRLLIALKDNALGRTCSLDERIQLVADGKLPPPRLLGKIRNLGATPGCWKQTVRNAEILLANNQATEALPWLLGAQKAKEDDPYLLALIGLAWQATGDQRSARSFYTRALDFAPASKILQDLISRSTSESGEPGQRIVRSDKTSERARIHVAILTYNALSSTKMCVESLFRTATQPITVHVFDNNSSKDDTRAWLKSQESERFRVCLGEQNLGVPGGRNRLVDLCLPGLLDDDMVLFIDNDIEFFPGWDAIALDILERNPRIGVLSADGHRMIVETDKRRLLPKSLSIAHVDTACGYCFWVRASVLRAVGGFDENLGLFWHEDDDFAVHVRANGFDAVAYTGIPILHRAHQSGAAVSESSARISSRNQAYLCRKWKAMGVVDGQGRIRQAPSISVRQSGRMERGGDLLLSLPS